MNDPGGGAARPRRRRLVHAGHPLPPDGRTTLYESLDYLVDQAGRAPSPMNLQPWRFRARRGGLDLLGDPGQVPDRSEAQRRQMVVACGAALFNLRLALRHLGFEPRVSVLPHDDDPELLARLEPGPHIVPGAHDEELLAAVPRRHTHRAPFHEPDLPAPVVEGLVGAAASEGASLVVPTGPGRNLMASILAAAEAEHRDDPATAASLRASWSAGGGVGLLTVLCTPDDTTTDWLVAGQALQRLLLTGATAWVQARFYTLALEDCGLRERLRHDVCGGLHPQVVLELGHVTTRREEVRAAAPAARS